MELIQKKFINNELNMEITSFIDNKQNIWFKGKEIATILVCVHADDAIRNMYLKNSKQTYPGKSPGQVRHMVLIN